MKAAPEPERPSTDADTPRLVQASLDPSGAVRDAGAIAYNLLLAQEGREPPAPAEGAPASPATTSSAATPPAPASAVKVAAPVAAAPVPAAAATTPTA